MTGQDTAPFATMFAVYASTVTKLHDPVFIEVDLEVDVDARKGRVVRQGLHRDDRATDPQPGDGRRQPAQIACRTASNTRSPRSAAPHPPRPARCWCRSTTSTASSPRIHLNNNGVVRSRAAA